VFTKEHGAPIMFAEIAIRRALGGEPEVPPIPNPQGHACVLLTDHNLRSDASKRTRISRGLLGVHSRYGLHTSHMTESRHAHAGVDVAINHRRRPVIP